jgi:hypothetical protein
MESSRQHRGEAMKRASLWEDTIVISMRDIQWINEFMRNKAKPQNELLVPASVNPPGFIKMDGHVESKLGDVALKDGERFFLFEVKSVREQVRTEWRKGGGENPKKLFQRLKGLVEDLNKRPAPDTNLKLSLRGHFVAYWTAKEEVDGLKGGICVEPYILACSTARNAKEIASREGMPLPRKVQTNSINHGGGTKKNTSKAALNKLLKGDVSLQMMSGGKIAPFGLGKAEFIDYVTFLCEELCSAGDGSPAGGRGRESLHAVVLSTHGSHFEVIADTSQLAMLLDGNFRPDPKKGRFYKAQSAVDLGNTPRG